MSISLQIMVVRISIPTKVVLQVLTAYPFSKILKPKTFTHTRRRVAKRVDKVLNVQVLDVLNPKT